MLQYKIEVVLQNGEPANLYAPDAYEAQCIAEEFASARVVPIVVAW